MSRLRRDNERLKDQLDQAQRIIEIQGNVSELLDDEACCIAVSPDGVVVFVTGPSSVTGWDLGYATAA